MPGVGPMVAVGRVVSSRVAADGSAMFATVELEHYRAGASAMTAECRVVLPFGGLDAAGDAFGVGLLPRAASYVLCFFPGLGPEGVPGDDLDNGYCFGSLSSPSVPLPADDAGNRPALNRLVLRAPKDSGIALWIEGLFGGLRAVVEAAVDWVVGSMTVSSAGTIRLETDASSSADVEIDADGNFRLDATIARLVSDDLRLGSATSGAVRKLIDERFVAVFNSHTHPHPVVADTLAPNEQIAVDTHTTTKTRAS